MGGFPLCDGPIRWGTVTLSDGPISWEAHVSVRQLKQRLFMERPCEQRKETKLIVGCTMHTS